MVGFEFYPAYTPNVINDKDVLSGYEHGTDQIINDYAFAATYKEPRARWNALAGYLNLVLGARTTVQDGAETAYRHKLTPVAYGTALANIQGEHKKGGLQYYYRGIMGNTIKLSWGKSGFLNMEVGLIGSGTRATSATSFVASIVETPINVAGAKIWLETGTDISISASPVQGSEGISSSTPDNLHPKIESGEFAWANDLQPVGIHAAGGVLNDMDYGRRKGNVAIVATVAIVSLTLGPRTFPPSVYGKIATALYILTVAGVLLFDFLGRDSAVVDVLVWVSLAITLLSGFHYVVHVRRTLNQPPGSP